MEASFFLFMMICCVSFSVELSGAQLRRLQEFNSAINCREFLDNCGLFNAAAYPAGTCCVISMPPGSSGGDFDGFCDSCTCSGNIKTDKFCECYPANNCPQRCGLENCIGLRPQFATTAIITDEPTDFPTNATTDATTDEPTYDPTVFHTNDPTDEATNATTDAPTVEPTMDPANAPTDAPTVEPIMDPTNAPTDNPTDASSNEPTTNPTIVPTYNPMGDTIDPTMVPTQEPTTEPTVRRLIDLPERCLDHCDAFSVLLNNVEYHDDDDMICLEYIVNRLFSDGACFKSIQHLTLGLCEQDVIGGRANNNILHGLIESIYSNDFPTIRAFGSSQGITIKFGGRVNTEISFVLCLKDVFKDDVYSEAVIFKKGRKKYFCEESYLFGLPCFNDAAFIDVAEQRDFGFRAINGDKGSDVTKRVEANSSDFWKSIKGIFIILGIVFVIIMVVFGVWLTVNLRKKERKYDKVDDVEIDTKEETTNNMDDELEMVDSKQRINEKSIQ